MHFLCTARFPMHKVNGQMKKYVAWRCVFFRGWVLLSVWRHGLSIRQEDGWLTGRKLYLLESRGSSNLFLTILLVLIPIFITGGIHLDGFWYTGCFKFLSADGTQTEGILKDSHAEHLQLFPAVYIFSVTGIYSILTAHAVKVIAIGFILSRTLSGLSVICFHRREKKKDRGLVATFSESAEKE